MTWEWQLGWGGRFLAGGALFFASLLLLRAALLRLAGQRVVDWMLRWSHNRWRAAALGACTAALLQSSSATSLIVVNLVHAGWLDLRRALALILGANVGTTTTVQLISVDWHGALPYVACAGCALVFTCRGALRQAGVAVAALAGLLTGVEWMGSTMVEIAAAYPAWVGWLRMSGDSLWRPLGFGAVLTALVQSSSVTTGVAMVMAASGLVTAMQGIAVMLGANVGTVATTLLGTVGASRQARRAAVGDLLFNALGVVAVCPLLDDAKAWSLRIMMDPTRQIATAHALFNGITVVIGLFALNGLVRLAELVVPERKGPN